MSFIPLDVAVKFFIPVRLVRGWAVGMMTSGMLMPEATMNEDCCTPARKDNVGLAGQVGPVKPEAVARPVEEAEIGRASCRERGEVRVVAVALKRKYTVG